MPCPLLRTVAPACLARVSAARTYCENTRGAAPGNAGILSTLTKEGPTLFPHAAHLVWGCWRAVPAHPFTLTQETHLRMVPHDGR